ncbi:MAG: hypothetical protein C0404_02500 [Verrucomicrobia bacterium]|nr:hypothetical protein [Verrucomicrobiota bacterium]
MKRSRYINIDVGAISSISHRCTGCASPGSCCCAKYEICVRVREMKTIIGALPLAAKYCPWLKDENGFDNVFDETERGLFAIDTHDNGLCVFAYHCDSGIRCSLHSAALQIGMPPHLLKPFSCTLWPLVLREPPGAMLSITGEALQFPCNRTRKGKPAISPEIIDSIRNLLGAAVCGRIMEAANKGIQKIRVPLQGPLAGGI